MIERQVRRDVSDLEEAKRQYGLTRNSEYLRFMTLRAEGLLEDKQDPHPRLAQPPAGLRPVGPRAPGARGQEAGQEGPQGGEEGPPGGRSGVGRVR